MKKSTLTAEWCVKSGDQIHQTEMQYVIRGSDQGQESLDRWPCTPWGIKDRSIERSFGGFVIDRIVFFMWQLFPVYLFYDILFSVWYVALITHFIQGHLQHLSLPLSNSTKCFQFGHKDLRRTNGSVRTNSLEQSLHSKRLPLFCLCVHFISSAFPTNRMAVLSVRVDGE